MNEDKREFIVNVYARCPGAERLSDKDLEALGNAINDRAQLLHQREEIEHRLEKKQVPWKYCTSISDAEAWPYVEMMYCGKLLNLGMQISEATSLVQALAKRVAGCA